MRLTRKTVSKYFRTRVAELYPGINKNPAYWGLMEYLMFGCKLEEETGKLLIDQELLAKIEGKEALLESGNYKAWEFLEAFQRDVMSADTFQWSRWNHDAGVCRKVMKCEFSFEMMLALVGEYKKEWHSSGRVYFRDGSKFSAAKQREERELTLAEAVIEMQRARCPEAKTLLQYLNNLPPNLFTKMLANIDSARVVASKIKDETKRNLTLNILNSIEDQPQPYYQPSGKGRTVRIFTLNESLLLLPRSVRAELTKHWTKFDLRSSQLAICAFTWDVPLVKDFLLNGGNVWEALFNHLGLDYGLKQSNPNLYDEIKDCIKPALYSVLYGMEERDISRLLTNALKLHCVEKGGILFRNHPLIAAMLKARSEQLEKIESEGGAVDCFGNELKIDASTNAKSILAQLAQAAELYLLYPVVELAISHPDDFKITVWLHDGFCVSILHKSRHSNWVRHIQQAVENRARLVGIPTVLEC